MEILSLHLQLNTLGDVRHQPGDEALDHEDDVLERDHKCQPPGDQRPVVHGDVTGERPLGTAITAGQVVGIECNTVVSEVVELHRTILELTPVVAELFENGHVDEADSVEVVPVDGVVFAAPKPCGVDLVVDERPVDQLRDEVRGEGDHERVGDHGKVSHGGEAAIPDADVLGAFGIRPTDLRQHLLSVEADLNQVVDQREDGRQREGGHEQRDEAKLDDHLEILGEEAVLRDFVEVVVLLPLGQLFVARLLVVALGEVDLHPRQDEFDEVVDGLVGHHNHGQLRGQLNQTSAGAAFLHAEASQARVVRRVAGEVPLEKGDVED